MMIKLLFLTLTSLFVLSGCTAKLTEPAMNFEPPKYVEQIPSKVETKSFRSTGSIFGQGDNPLFSDHKAMHVHDLVTVIISESAISSNSATKKTAESDKMGLGGGTVVANGGNPAISAYADMINGFTNVGFKTDSTSAYSGQGSSTKNAKFTTTISARVVKVLSNGNYYISGKRELMIDDEKQFIQIAGVIRPYDIDQNNRINSAQISDAKILYSSEGDINKAINQGWGSKLFGSIWPF